MNTYKKIELQIELQGSLPRKKDKMNVEINFQLLSTFGTSFASNYLLKLKKGKLSTPCSSVLSLKPQL